MMISVDKFQNRNILRENNEIESDNNSKDELTLITANNFTERAQSLIDDDVESDVQLDLYPVKEFQNYKSHQVFKPQEQIEIIDIPEKIKSYYDKSNIIKCEDSTDSFKDKFQEMFPTRDVDEYDLEHVQYGYNDSIRYCDELLKTVKHRPQPSFTLTKHEAPPLSMKQLHESSTYCAEHEGKFCVSPATTDIGRQITQLARRIESLGNISRVCQDDIENYPVASKCDECVLNTNDIHRKSHQNELVKPDNYSLKAARKLDEIERLQKKQEAMQSRLVGLAQKLNDSTRDLSRPPNTQEIYDECYLNDELFHAKHPKMTKKSTKKTGQKGRKTIKVISNKLPQPSFLKNILNDIEEPKTNELPLLSSSYCLHNDLSSGTAESGISESTSKYLNDELANIRSEFRTQVEEIRKLLSDRYQQSNELSKKNQNTQFNQESLSDQIAKSVQKLSRDASPSLRNITNFNNNNSEECPLDKYLVRKTLTIELPSLDSEIIPSLRPGILPSVARAIKNKQRMLSDPVEAEKFLIELSNRRANLENNLNCLERTKEGEFLFSILEKLQGDETNVDIARIQAMVDDAIASMSPIVNQEVKQEFLIWIEKRKQQREQQLITEEEEKQLTHKIKCSKTAKFANPVKYNPLPSTSAVAGKPWVCRKYLTVRSKVDSGVRKLPEKPISRVPRYQSPVRSQTVTAPDTHASWANRRRYRTPYLHFVNDVKLAKRPIGPLGDEMRKVPTITQWKEKSVTKKSHPHKPLTDDDLVLMSIKQYSLDYTEDEIANTPKPKPQLFTKSTSPQSISESPSSRPESRNSVNGNGHITEQNKTSEIAVQTQSRQLEPPHSPTFSEKGTGFQVRSKQSSKPREDRVGPFVATDPTETTNVITRPVQVLVQRPEKTAPGPDINNLRHLIERALLDQIHITSPTTSTDFTETIPQIYNVATPLPTEAGDGYTSPFSPEHSIQDYHDRSLTMINDIKTPDASQMISEYSFKPSRVSTPSNSAIFSQKSSPKKAHVREMVSEAIQTICDNASQTQETKEVQTRPLTTATQTAKSPSMESGSVTSELNGSQTDTQVHSFSDGMWLYDRSEGEMAPYQIDTVARWKLGQCPENPLWYNGTENLTNVDRHSSLSFGEFTKPTLPGLIPTLDPVLQLKTLPFKQPYSFTDANNEDDNLVYMGHHHEPATPHFRSLGVSRDSKSKFTTPRNEQASPTHFNDSEGEVEFDDESVDSYLSEDDHKSEDDKPNVQSSEEYRQQSPYFLNMRQSNESGPSDVHARVRDSHSDRMHIDENKYLRASKQSHSDMSETAGLMSTGQIVANAFLGGDSGDFDGYSDAKMEKFSDNQYTNKHTVKMPTLGTVEQSNPSISDDNLEIIDI